MRVRLPGRREGTDEQWVADQALKRYGVPSVKVGHSGWPDRWYLLGGGRLLIIEHKRYSGTEAMARQEWRLHQLRSWGYDARLIDDRDEALRAIGEAVEAAAPPAKGPAPAGGKRRLPAPRQPGRR